MSRYRAGDETIGEALLYLLGAAVLVIALFVGLHACQASDRADCENRGGVWLVRESACVSGPPGG